MLGTNPFPKLGISITAVLALAFTGACAVETKPISYLEPEAAGKRYAAVSLRPTRNASGKTVSRDLLDRTTARLEAKLREKGMVVTSEEAAKRQAQYMVLVPRLDRYEGGDAFGRWLTFGGAAVCTLSVDLIDGRSRRDVGDVISTHTVEAGGLATIGAERYIVDYCADGAAEGIVREIRPQRGL